MTLGPAKYDDNKEISLNSDIESDDGMESEAQQLQDILDQEENSPISRSNRIDTICLNLTSAALAVSADEAAQVYVVLVYFFFLEVYTNDNFIVK